MHSQVRLSCERLLSGGGAELWGRGGKPGLLGLLLGSQPGATLLLDDVHLVRFCEDSVEIIDFVEVI